MFSYGTSASGVLGNLQPQTLATVRKVTSGKNVQTAGADGIYFLTNPHIKSTTLSNKHLLSTQNQYITNEVCT
jgi:coproporphyrinogen III oxidase